MLRTFVCSGLFCLAGLILHGQESSCANWPADCPDNNSIENARSVSVRLANGLLKSEIETQDKVRQIVSELMQKASTALRWPVVPLEEMTGLNGFQRGETPPGLRSPREIDFYFQFVVSEDSLKHWKTWKQNDVERRKTVGTNAVESYDEVTSSPAFKKLMDSSNHYRDLYVAYLDKHKNEGAAILTDKTAGHYSKKMNEFSDKAVALETGNIETNGWKELENEGRQTAHRFRNATIVYVRIGANVYNGEMNDEVNTCVNFPIAGATIAKEGKINDEENGYYHEFGRWDHMIVLLLGNWSKKKENGNYPAGFIANGQGDERTPKKISSDKIQNLSVHIMGNKINIEKFVTQLDLQKLNDMIYKN